MSLTSRTIDGIASHECSAVAKDDRHCQGQGERTEGDPDRSSRQLAPSITFDSRSMSDPAGESDRLR